MSEANETAASPTSVHCVVHLFRKCKKCQQEKEIGDFCVRNQKTGTRRLVCRQCQATENRKRYSPEKNREYQQRYKENRPGDYLLAKTKYRNKNKETLNARARQRRLEKLVDAEYVKSRRQASRDMRANLRDGYVRQVMLSNGFLAEQINTELIAAYRALMRLKRELKNEKHR